MASINVFAPMGVVSEMYLSYLSIVDANEGSNESFANNGIRNEMQLLGQYIIYESEDYIKSDTAVLKPYGDIA